MSLDTVLKDQVQANKNEPRYNPSGNTWDDVQQKMTFICTMAYRSGLVKAQVSSSCFLYIRMDSKIKFTCDFLEDFSILLMM